MPKTPKSQKGGHGGPLFRVALYTVDRSEYALRVTEGVLQYAEDHSSYAVRVFQDDLTSSGRPEALFAGPPPWEAWMPDGVVANLPHGRKTIAWLKGRTTPLVSLGIEFQSDLPNVHISVDSIAKIALEHIRETGYPNVGFLGVEGDVSVEQRRLALEERCAKSGTPFKSYSLKVNPWPGLYDLEARAAAEPGLHQFLRDLPKPAGILAATDQAGRVICTTCETLDLLVPQEIGVLGIDNYQAARACIPPLSSIHTPGEDVGYEAMAMLDRMRRGEPAGGAVAVRATRLVARQSTGAGAGGQESDVVRALALIHARACDGIEIEQLLEELTVSRSTLQRQFAALVGRSPGQEMLRVRLARAKELLRTTDLPLTQIASMTGYERSSSFSDSFHRNVGVSPSAYREAGVRIQR